MGLERSALAPKLETHLARATSRRLDFAERTAAIVLMIRHAIVGCAATPTIAPFEPGELRHGGMKRTVC